MKITEKDKYRIYELRQSGMKVKDIAERYNVGSPYACQIIKEVEGSEYVTSKKEKARELLEQREKERLENMQREKEQLDYEKKCLKERYRKLGIRV